MEEYLGNLKNMLDRRSFLKCLGILSVGFFAPSAFTAPLVEEKFNKKLYKLEETKALMGTFVTITVLDPSKIKAEEAISAGFNEIKRLIRIFNRFSDNTTISELNEKGVLKNIPPEMHTVIKQSFKYHQLTQGYFDITVKPLVDLFKETFAVNGNPPTLEEIKSVLSLVGMKNISYSDKEIKFVKTDMGITLDGIAKGYIVDKVAKLMQKLKVSYALINAGGDIRVIGNRKWQIAIRDPFNHENYVDIITLKNNAIATSGNYEVYFDKEKLYHHIINPFTGYSPTKVVSVSIVAKTTAEADALSTAVLALGPIKGKQIINKLSDVEGLIITKNNLKLQSYNWRNWV